MIKDMLYYLGLSMSIFGTKFDLWISYLNQGKLCKNKERINQNKEENKKERHNMYKIEELEE